MKYTTVHDCRKIPLKTIHRPEGQLTIIEAHNQVPFDIKRIYYLHDVPDGVTRGNHAHRNLWQMMVAMRGIVNVVLDDGVDRRGVKLTSPCEGLLVVPGIWRELNGFYDDALCMVVASELYDENDYIRDYDKFLLYKL